ncbi:MAG TPA: ATP synthase subunit C [Bacilli bacterium]|nr:ATP synthase subunit C [Bacilli bacterium]HPS18759.1 ATP synthase subunit C [Bacilli bacterium]
MNEWIVLGSVLVGLVLICLPLVKVFRGKVTAGKAKKRIILHVSLFFALIIGTVLVAPGVLGAEIPSDSTITGEIYKQAAAFGYIGAAIATGCSALGAGIAVAAAAPAAIGAISENPKNLGKALIFVALGEGVAIYGLLISILILNNIPVIA